MITVNNWTLSYECGGIFISEEEWAHSERIENTYEIICVVDGIIYIQEEDARYTLRKGDVLILKPGVLHKGFRKSEGSTSFYWVHFSVSNFSALDISKMHIEGFTDIAMFKQLLHIANTPDYPAHSPDGMLLCLLAEFSCFSKQNETVKKIKSVHEAAEWIRVNAYLPITALQVSKRFGYSNEHFSKMFKKEFSVNLKEYINSEKMKLARDYLSHYSSYSVKQISDILSFKNANQFVHYFKYHQKQSPTEFRNSLVNTHMVRA